LNLTGSTALNSGSILNFALGTGESSSQLALTGSYSGPGAGAVTVNIASLTNTTAAIYTLITGAAGISAGSFALGTAPLGYNYALSATAGTLSLNISSPAAPTNLTATGTNGSVLLNWSASSGAISYDVRRSVTSGSGYALLTAVSGTTTYTDTAVTNGTTYYYVVSAVNLAGAGANSVQASATPLSLLQAWRLANFGTISNSGNAADTASPAHDGICNLLKYATGIAPFKLATSVAALGISTTNNPLTLTFNRIADPSLTYSVLASTDLINWQSIWTSSGSQNVSGAVTVTDSSSISTNPQRFLELQISY
jgi:cellulose 1,4-beta-cellobiosidase